MAILEPPVKDSPKLPRKLKKQAQKAAEKANPTNSPSRMHRATTSKPQGAKRAKTEQQPKPKSAPKRPSVSPVSLAGKLVLQNPEAYAKAKDTKVDATTLADEIVKSSFQATLARYSWCDPHLLVKSAIDHIRAERPKVESDKSSNDEPSRKRELTAAQRAQREREAAKRASQPAMNTVSAYTRPKGAPKTVLRHTYDDTQIVHDALKALFQKRPELKEMFCRASSDGAVKKLLHTNAHIKRLTKALREGVTSPSRVYTHLETAARNLIAAYRSELEAAEQLAAREAAARHEERKITAIQAAATRVKARNKKANMGVIPKNLRNEMARAS